MNTTTKPVCGLVDPELASKVVGADEFSTTGPGAISKQDRLTDMAHCIIRNEDRTGASLQVRIGEIDDPARWKHELAAEAKREKCTVELTGDPGTGYACHYETGVYAAGTGINVVRGDRLIRVIGYHWLDVSEKHRLDVLTEVVRNVDENLTDFDRTSTSS